MAGLSPAPVIFQLSPAAYGRRSLLIHRAVRKAGVTPAPIIFYLLCGMHTTGVYQFIVPFARTGEIGPW